MYYCISYFRNNNSNYFVYSIIIDYKNNFVDVISVFHRNSFNKNLLFSKFIEWIDEIIKHINVNVDNFWFVNYKNFYLHINDYLEMYYGNKENIPTIFKYSYSVNELFSNVYGFTKTIPIERMKNFMRIELKEKIIDNIECNDLVYIFLECLNNYGSRIKNYIPTIVF